MWLLKSFQENITDYLTDTVSNCICLAVERFIMLLKTLDFWAVVDTIFTLILLNTGPSHMYHFGGCRCVHTTSFFGPICGLQQQRIPCVHNSSSHKQLIFRVCIIQH